NWRIDLRPYEHDEMARVVRGSSRLPRRPTSRCEALSLDRRLGEPGAHGALPRAPDRDAPARRAPAAVVSGAPTKTPPSESVAHHEIARAHLARARAVLEHRRMRRIVVGLVLLVALVIVPFLLWGEALEEAVIPWIGAASHPAVAATLVALVMASDVLLPIPSSLVGVTAGALLGWPLGTVALAVGATLGCLVAYALGRLADEGLGRWVKPEDHARVDRFFSRYGR